MGNFQNLKGMQFGRLTVIDRAENRNGRVYWICKCSCGNMCVVKSYSLKGGYTKSCGCYKQERSHEYLFKHGEKKTKLYVVWCGMRGRCNCKEGNYNYKYYSGRGIKVCDEWNDYLVFKDWALKNGYREGLTIERIDVNGNYCPENCKWITRAEQCNNTRYNRKIDYNGKTKTMTQWAKEKGIDVTTLYSRLKKGWDIERALTEKVASKERFLEFNGKVMSLSSWARETGINFGTIEGRLKYGWSIEDALTIKPSHSNKKLKITKAKQQTTQQETSHED